MRLYKMMERALNSRGKGAAYLIPVFDYANSNMTDGQKTDITSVIFRPIIHIFKSSQGSAVAQW